MLAFVLLCLVSSSYANENDWSKTVHLKPDGHDTSACGRTESDPCRTLDFTLETFVANSTRFLLRPGRYSLSGKHDVKRVSNFAIVGVKDVEVDCAANSSLAFWLTSNIVLEGVKFHRCGGLRLREVVINSKNKFATFVCALYFNYCKNLSLSGVQVVDTPGLGLTLYNVGGVVNISDSIFADNRAPEVNPARRSSGEAGTGGGAFIGLGTAVVNVSDIGSPDPSTYGSNNVFVIERSNFTRNAAPRTFVSDNDYSSVPFTRGGGLAIIVGGHSSNNIFRISSCSFRNNSARWGGGIEIKFINRSQNNNVSIKGTIFDSNEAHLAGGGARVGTLIKVDETLQYNNFFFANCVFRNNHAKWGGGVSVFGTTRPTPQWEGHIGKVAEFVACQWRKNHGVVGAAIGAFLVNLNPDDIGPRIPFHLELEHCNISDNVVLPPPRDVEVGQGAVYTVQVPVILRGFTLIAKNSETAMVLDSSTLEVYDQVRIYWTFTSGFYRFYYNY